MSSTHHFLTVTEAMPLLAKGDAVDRCGTVYAVRDGVVYFTAGDYPQTLEFRDHWQPTDLRLQDLEPMRDGWRALTEVEAAYYGKPVERPTWSFTFKVRREAQAPKGNP